MSASASAVTRMAVAGQHRAAWQVTPTQSRGAPDQRRTSVVACRTDASVAEPVCELAITVVRTRL